MAKMVRDRGGQIGIRPLIIGILAFSAIVSMAYGAQITLTPKTFSEKKTGDSLSASCRVDGVTPSEPEEKLYWAKVTNGENVPISSSGRVYARTGLNRTSVMLLIGNAEKQDEGEYKCMYGSLSESISLSLYESIKFVDTPTDQHPLAGTDATIVCTATGDPKPDISWTKDGVEIEESDEISFVEKNLKIKNYNPAKHDGIYKCEAIQTEAGDLMALDINVTGHVPPGPVTVTLVDQERWTKGIHENASARLTCSATGVPLPDLKWSRNQGELVENDHYGIPERGVLEIKSMRQDDVGAYTCTATNAVGKNESALSVDIYLLPQITEFADTGSVVIGQDFTTTCSYTGGDQLAVSITRNADTIPVRANTGEGSGDGESINEKYVVVGDKTATLNIKAATLDDAGEYHCTVTNDAGGSKKILKLAVHQSPKIVSYTQDTVRAVPGHTHTLFCHAFAIPEPVWTWSKSSGGDINNEEGHFEIAGEGSNSTLKIQFQNDDDFVNYVCKADNKVEPPASQEIKVLKIESPQKPVITCVDDSTKSTAIVVKSDTYSENETENKRPRSVEIIAFTETDQKDFALEFAQDGVYKLTKLQPGTEYTLNVTGKNEAGNSESSRVVCTTKPPTVPSQPVFDFEGDFRCATADCPLQWSIEDDGGRQITEYVIEYRQIPTDGDEQAAFTKATTTDRQFSFSGLQPASSYQVKVKAINEEGEGEPATFNLHTADEYRQVGGDSSYQSATGPSTGAIVGIVVIIILIIVVLIDVACYYVNQCGLLMCICVNLCGKTPPDAKVKETIIEEGGAVKDTRFEERQEKQPLKEEHLTVTVEKTEVDTSESTPMMGKI